MRTGVPQRVQRLYPHLDCIACHCVKPYDDLGAPGSHIRFFTFLRDPAARYISHYLDRARVYDRDAFDKWVASSWTQNWQAKKIAGVPDADRAIEIMQQRIGFVGLTSGSTSHSCSSVNGWPSRAFVLSIAA